MYLKVHRNAAGDQVVAVCDRELLNTTISHGDLEVRISGDFYGTSLATPDEVRAALVSAENANLIGERTIALAESLGLINRSGCIMIGDVPHAQVFWI
jgi:hypothetical protein